MAYPATIDTMTPTSGTQTLGSANHNNIHNTFGSAVVAIETVLGTTAGTSVLKNFSAGNFAARTNGETFGTPVLTNPTVNVGSDATGDLYYRNSGGSVSRLAVGSVAQHLVVSAGTLPAWADDTSVPHIKFIGGTQTTVGTSTAGAIDLVAATIVATAAGTLQATAGGRWSNNASSQDTFASLLFGSGTLHIYSMRENTATLENAFSLTGVGTYAAGTHTIKVQGSRGGGTAFFGSTNLSVMYS